jgi:NAD(P)-dependent dehydrogenase (short-subunit alcohol dehydrogenase family)
VVADATQEYDINHLFDAIHFDESALQLAVYNVDSNIPAPILETKSETFTALWQQNCLGAFLFAKEAIECMQPNKQGTLIFTGATASLRAKPPFTAFASAKAALRSLAQGLAREFSPAGIHVVHTIFVRS